MSPLVLVTGGAGFIGHHLCNDLLARGAQVRVLDDLSTGLRGRLPAGHPNYEFIQGNVLDWSVVQGAGQGVDLVLHLAAVVGMRRVFADPAYALRVSDEGTSNVLRATNNAPALLMSSSAVYGLHPQPLSHETEVVSWGHCLSYDGAQPGYACGKFLLEQRAYDSRRAGRGVLVIRPFNVVGRGQLGAYGMVLPEFVRRALNGEPLRVYGDGMQSRSFGHIETFASCVLGVLQSPTAWASGYDAINIGAPHESAIRDVAHAVLRQTSSKSQIEFVPYQREYPGKEDVRQRCPDIGRLCTLIGSINWPNLEEIIKDVVSSLASQHTRDAVMGSTCVGAV